MLDYYLILAISFLGLGIGWILSKLAWEEVRKYERILKSFRFLIILLSFALLLTFLNDVLLVSLLLVMYIFLYSTGKQSWAYSSLPLLLWLSYGDVIFPYIASLLLFYGFIEGSMKSRNMRNGKSIDALLVLLKENYWYLVVGVILGIAI